MSAFTQLLAQAPKTRSLSGVIDRWVETLDKDDQKDFMQAVNDPSIPSVTIAHVMRRLGYTGGNSTFNHWRNTQCRK